MIRLFYWLMVLIEILLIFGTILLFIITDSRTIHIATKNILREYGVNYKKISGNLFTGIEVSSLKYNGRKLVESATIYWNPFALVHNRVHITRLQLQGVELEGIVTALDTLPKSDGEKDKSTLFFDFHIDKINLTVNPFVYHGVEFKNFYFGMVGLAVDRDMQMRSEVINFLVDSDLVDLNLRGKIEQNSLNLDNLQLLKIDPKVITYFVRSIKKEQKSKMNSQKEGNKEDKKETNSSGVALGDITVDNFFATMKKTTYGPVTIDKTKIIAQNLLIEPKNGFEYSATEASISTDTTFASTKQVGYIKNSSFYGKGDILTKKYLYDRYSLPLNQKELKKIPAKLKVNHQGVWVEVEHGVKDILALKNSDFNVNLKKVKHKFDYLYSDFFIKIGSKGIGSITYADEVEIESIVDIDFSGDGDTEVVYSGEVKLKTIKNIPKEVSENLLENLTAKYRGTPDELLGRADSQQIKGTFFTDGYENAKLKIDSKGTLPLDNLLKSLPKGLYKGSLGEIQSDSYIDFFDSSKSKIGIDIDSNLINLKTSMELKEPFKIKFSASIPKDSKITNIDKRIRVKNISNIDGEVILNRDITHISLFSEDLKFSCDYNSERDRFGRGLIVIADEKINFDGSLSSKIDIKSHIENMDRFGKTINRYYDINLPKMSGRADIDMKFNADSSLNIFAKSKNIGYMDFRGDIETTVNIDKNRVVDIEFKSKKL
ncbi:hypothetical protein GSY74_05580, partial [Sulfurovum sp. bin170]|uniref:hypothetical protein n=1 Tax=Sulfurovum sp. bin170 TaxID=2695268 RepID=UPI0013E0E837